MSNPKTSQLTSDLIRALAVSPEYYMRVLSRKCCVLESYQGFPPVDLTGNVRAFDILPKNNTTIAVVPSNEPTSVYVGLLDESGKFVTEQGSVLNIQRDVLGWLAVAKNGDLHDRRSSIIIHNEP